MTDVANSTSSTLMNNFPRAAGGAKQGVRNNTKHKKRKALGSLPTNQNQGRVRAGAGGKKAAGKSSVVAWEEESGAASESVGVTTRAAAKKRRSGDLPEAGAGTTEDEMGGEEKSGAARGDGASAGGSNFVDLSAETHADGAEEAVAEASSSSSSSSSSCSSSSSSSSSTAVQDGEAALLCTEDITESLPEIGVQASKPAVTDIDLLHTNDPRYCTSYMKEYFTYQLQLEHKFRAPKPGYLDRPGVNEVTPNMRSILIDWLVEVAEEYKLRPPTLFIR